MCAVSFELGDSKIGAPYWEHPIFAGGVRDTDSRPIILSGPYGRGVEAWAGGGAIHGACGGSGEFYEAVVIYYCVLGE